MIKHFLLYLLFLITFFPGSNAQTFNFRNYNVNDDLPQAYIYTIIQSPKGKLYIGTGEGLSNFDGKKFTNYTTSDGLAENFVTTSFLDRKGNLWFGHYQGGITFFDGNSFRKINLNEILSGPVNSFAEDKDGNIWIGTQRDGIMRIDTSKHVTTFKNTLPNCSVNSLVFVHPDELIAATSNGLLTFKFSGKTLTLSKKLLHDVAVLNIIRKRKGNDYWVTTSEEGIFTFDNEKDSTFEVQSDVSLKDKNINLIYEDNDSNLWISLYGEGLSRYALIAGVLVKLDVYNTETGLSNNYVKSFFADRENNIWIGTFGGGLDQLIDPVFTLYSLNDGLLSNNITALCQDENKLWVGSDQGIAKLIFSEYKQNNLENKKIFTSGIPSGEITSICLDGKNHLLLGTDEKGIWRFDKNTNQCKQWFYNPSNQLQNKIHHIIADSGNNIWIATEDGAFRFQQATKKFEHFNMESGLLHNKIYSIFIDSKNAVWFATHSSGLSSYQNGAIKNFASPQESSGIDINCFGQDKSGNLWIGTYGQGAYIFNGNNFIRRYSQKDGLGSNYIYVIIKDKNNFIWLGHKNGISKYDYKKRSFSFHQKKEGFLTEEINNNAGSTDEDDNLWFGTTNGLLKYNLKADKPTTLGPLINIYDVRLFFQEVDWSHYSDSLFSLYRLPAHLILPYNENHLTFSVKGISLSNPDKVKYKYKLEGFEKEWSLETNESFITYSNMPPGHYTFMAIAKNNEGIWSEEPATLSFDILSPFWKTWWFSVLSIIFILSLIFMAVKIRTKSLENRQKELQEEKVKLLAEIRERKKAERMQQISEEKLRQTNQELNTFIYRASHDLRGPLSTVKGLTNLGMMEIKDENSLRYFNLISDRIIRLDMILKDLIHIVEITEIDLELESIDLSQCIDDVLNSLTDMPSKKNLVIKKELSYHNTFINDKKLISIVLTNTIDNAVKYTNPDNRVSTVVIEISDYQNGILVVISDNGMGIPPDIQNKIFDMFFRGTDQSKGSGLGLYLVNKIINKLEGTVQVTSEYMKGTKIELYLPSMLFVHKKIKEGSKVTKN
jgi:ligand-binding sensor domain-containing protein/signal transduction histidine kinase